MGSWIFDWISGRVCVNIEHWTEYDIFFFFWFALLLECNVDQFYWCFFRCHLFRRRVFLTVVRTITNNGRVFVACLAAAQRAIDNNNKKNHTNQITGQYILNKRWADLKLRCSFFGLRMNCLFFAHCFFFLWHTRQLITHSAKKFLRSFLCSFLFLLLLHTHVHYRLSFIRSQPKRQIFWLAHLKRVCVTSIQVASIGFIWPNACHAHIFCQNVVFVADWILISAVFVLWSSFLSLASLAVGVYVRVMRFSYKYRFLRSGCKKHLFQHYSFVREK